MLIQCPECELSVSDKALLCPHCGYPMKSNEKPRSPRSRKNRRKRLPNGFGQISEIRNQQLRKPFRAMVTVGKTSTGRPICKPLKPEAYFSTYNDAYAALVEYNRNPYDFDKDISINELYDKWISENSKHFTNSYMSVVSSAWSYCSAIRNMRVKDIRARHIKKCIEEGYRIETRGKNKGEKKYASPVIKSKMKSLFNNMLDYALEYEIVPKNYARTFEVSGDIFTEIEKNKKNHFPFSEEELAELWNNVDNIQFADLIIIQCYMGWRPQELATIRLDEVHLDKWYMQAGMKTDAGKQRIVPIHSKIRHLVQRNYDYAMSVGSNYLFNYKNNEYSKPLSLTYDTYSYRFKKVISQLKLNQNHRAHDPRLTFVTRGKKAKMDEYALKEIVGHYIQDITESVYTIRDLEWLREDIEKLN